MKVDRDASTVAAKKNECIWRDGTDSDATKTQDKKRKRLDASDQTCEKSVSVYQIVRKSRMRMSLITICLATISLMLDIASPVEASSGEQWARRTGNNYAAIPYTMYRTKQYQLPHGVMDRREDPNWNQGLVETVGRVRRRRMRGKRPGYLHQTGDWQLD